jgi:hypothetical protein
MGTEPANTPDGRAGTQNRLYLVDDPSIASKMRGNPAKAIRKHFIVSRYNMSLHWINHGGGHLARSPLGLYMTYQSFDLELGAVCWFGKFEIDGKLLGFGLFGTLSPLDAVYKDGNS